jgi:hypothetical protein
MHEQCPTPLEGWPSSTRGPCPGDALGQTKWQTGDGQMYFLRLLVHVLAEWGS